MKFITYVLLLQNLLFSQDSLFWFDANILDREMPQFPLIINKVLVVKYNPSANLKYEGGLMTKEV